MGILDEQREKIDVIFTRIDEINKKLIEDDKYKVLLNYKIEELEKLELKQALAEIRNSIKEINSFLGSVKKWLWIVISVCTTTAIGAILTVIVGGLQ